MRRKTTSWEKVLAKGITDKALLSKYAKGSKNSTLNKQIKKWPRDLNQHLGKEDVYMANRNVNCVPTTPQRPRPRALTTLNARKTWSHSDTFISGGDAKRKTVWWLLTKLSVFLP